MLASSRAAGALRRASPAWLIALGACSAEGSDLFSNKPDSSGLAGNPTENEGGAEQGSGGTSSEGRGGSVSAGGAPGAAGNPAGVAGEPGVGGEAGELGVGGFDVGPPDGGAGDEPMGGAGTVADGGAEPGAGGEGGGEALGGSAGTATSSGGDGGAGPGPDCETECDDGNPCTLDACDPELGCVYEPTTAACDDDNACTTNDACADGECAGSPVECVGEDPCTLAACNPETGECEGGPGCDDGNACTEDHCDDSGACSNLPAGVAEDGTDREIPDGPFSCQEPSDLASAELVLDEPGVIATVRVTLDLEHPYLGDLVARLEHVDSGTVVVLLNRVGPGMYGSRATLDGVYTLADGGAAWPNAGAPASGTYESSGVLANFVGENVAGTWRLEIGDGCQDDVGTLRGWGLRLGAACESAELECAGACDGASCVAVTPECN